MIHCLLPLLFNGRSFEVASFSRALRISFNVASCARVRRLKNYTIWPNMGAARCSSFSPALASRTKVTPPVNFFLVVQPRPSILVS